METLTGQGRFGAWKEAARRGAGQHQKKWHDSHDLQARLVFGSSQETVFVSMDPPTVQ
jgi:hypothetical protein